MSTDGKATPADDAERRAWFAQFGYTGDLDEVVILHQHKQTAPTTEVWAVLAGLRQLERDYNGLFHRAANWAHAERRPLDPAGHLYDTRYGALTGHDGDWLPGRREIVVALTRLNRDDDVFFEFRDQPLVPAVSNISEAA